MTATPDAKLLALSRQLEEASANWDRVNKQLDQLKGTPEFSKSLHLDFEASDRYNKIEDQIGATPATTIDGVVIKLRVVAMSLPTQGPLNVYETNIASALAAAEQLAGKAS